MLKILQYGNPILLKKTIEVENPSDPKVLKLIEDMLEVLEKEKDHSAGLSAPQVGQGIRLAICRRLDLEEERNKGLSPEELVAESKEPIWEVMINPHITFKSEETSTRWEGCLSIKEGDLFGEVERPRTVEVEYINIEGKKEKLKAVDYFSHVVQHELDHLEGILFLKYISDPEKLYTGDELENI